MKRNWFRVSGIPSFIFPTTPSTKLHEKPVSPSSNLKLRLELSFSKIQCLWLSSKDGKRNYCSRGLISVDWNVILWTICHESRDRINFLVLRKRESSSWVLDIWAMVITSSPLHNKESSKLCVVMWLFSEPQNQLEDKELLSLYHVHFDIHE